MLSETSFAFRKSARPAYSRPKAFAALTVSAAIVALTAGCASTPTEPSDTEPVIIPALLSISGGASFLGSGEKAALEALQDSVNADGGINGRDLEFEFLDDQTTPAVAAQLARGLVDEGVPAFLGPSLASTCGAVAPLIQASGPVSYCASPSVRPAAGSFQFSSSVGSYDQFDSMLNYFESEGWSRIAYIAASDATGQDGREQLPRSIDESDGDFEVVASESYETSDTALSAQATRIAAADPDVVIAWNSDASFGTVLSSLKQAGVTVPVITSMANMNLDLMESYAPNMPERLLFSTSEWPNYMLDETGPSADLRKEWVDILATKDLTPNATYSLAWDSALLLIDALRNGATTAAEIQDHINGLTDFAGILGTYDFSNDDQRGITVDNVIVAEWDKELGAWPPVSGPAGRSLD